MRAALLATATLAIATSGAAFAQSSGADPTQLPDFNQKIESYYEAQKPTEQVGKCTGINMNGVGGSQVVDRQADRVTVRVSYNYNSSTQGNTCVGSATRDFVFSTAGGQDPSIVSMTGPL